ncbi:MOSC domain-containing protein [Sphingomonas sp. AOB5]|uniref:MOSC domain-containing protein n=1 Tax=Sphingomonas sp. AOB5 TaxID=3034017 RepID=UPI0023F6C4CD|nr:MOSC domain-containing protein [Sphingomonas sp. AOB5]MDF7773854.1 MOSC domain-containing protein [Sphingomonas sp. AOB5]
MTGTLAGIALHRERKGPIETLDSVAVSVERGIEGCCRGILRPNSKNRRQVTVMEAGDWAAASREAGTSLDWWNRRVNLLVDGVDLPQSEGARIRIGGEVVLEVTVECDPCSRMDDLHMGLQQALKPDWRGGACTRVISGGHIAIGDEIRIEA